MDCSVFLYWMNILFFIVFTWLISGHLVTGTDRAAGDLSTFYTGLEMKKLNKSYDRRIRPDHEKGKPIVVGLKVYVNHISEISEKEMTVTMSIFLRQTWHDARLSLGHKVKVTDTGSLIRDIWVPDPYFVNGEDIKPSPDVGHRYFTIQPNGTVFFSERIAVPFACFMNLTYFPMDSQTCVLALESYGHTVSDMEFMIIGGGVDVNEAIELAQFTLANYKARITSRLLDTGNFSRFEISFSFDRQYGHYIFTVYIASVMIVCLSWVSFWLDIHAVPARISLGVLCVLTQTTQTMSVLSTIPRVSYIKAVDIWMASCLFFAFASLIEFAVANSAARLTEHKERQAMEKLANEYYENGTDELTPNHEIRVLPTISARTYEGNLTSDNVYPVQLTRRKGFKSQAVEFHHPFKHHPATHVLDRVSRVAFPIMFIVLNIVYWVVFRALPQTLVEA